MNIKGRDFITLMNYGKEELEGILKLAEDIKSGLNREKYLEGKNIGLMFSVASTRTRISFQVAARHLGGYAEFYNTNDLQLVNRESLVDTAEVMNRYLDGLVIRMYDMTQYGKGREALDLFAQHCGIPVINALDDKDHPCQIMGDILTMKEKFGENYKRKKLLVTWGYSKRQKSPGVPQSFLAAASILGMDLRIAYPKGFDLDPEYVEFAEKTNKISGGKLEFSHDLMEASENTDAIYVKNWKSFSLSIEDDRAAREKEDIKKDWCVSAEHFKRANPGAVYMDCLPLIRGEQVTAEVADGPQSIIYDEAENRLHIQKAILAALI
ncbi:MAG: ornithine carbamoyltransferase [Acidobacteria bacterium]|nr:ornithine carbamoyltransferase [Acidobacteriota bacterium]